MATIKAIAATSRAGDGRRELPERLIPQPFRVVYPSLSRVEVRTYSRVLWGSRG
jgi:hypothetical protein